MDARIQHIAQLWYLEEPALFTILCTHNVEENESIKCPIRCGKGKIEYNPGLVSSLSDKQVEEYLKAETIRIILRHPYERQPDGCSKESKATGSNLVISDNYELKQIKLPTPDDFGFEKGLSFEKYAYQVQDLLMQESMHMQTPDISPNELTAPIQANGDGNGDEQKPEQDLSSLWEEDAMMLCTIDNAISDIQAGHSWGSLAGHFAELIIANSKAKIDYRKVLSGFRATVISSKRHLTRMRPNRRSGFDNMGSIRRFNTNLLIAVDVSGSVSSNSLMHFYSIINRIFKYGIEKVDVVQFDTQLGKVEEMKKASKEIQVLGRGGTSFQPIVDYAGNHGYDGLIIFTDGYAPPPSVKRLRHCKLAWICDSPKGYERNRSWMEKLGRCCLMQL